MDKNKKVYYIVILRFVAVLLITNSHFDGVYPWDISFGGAPGVATFYLITGFLLARIKSRQSFVSWYGKKLMRLYPAIWISSIIFLLIGYLSVNSIIEVVNLFIYPTHWWYIKNLLIIYILFYIEKQIVIVPDKIWIAIWSTLYLVLFISRNSYIEFFVDSFYYRICYGMVSMHLGSILRSKWDNMGNILGQKEQSLKWLLLSLSSMASFLAAKLLIGRVNIAYHFQFLVHVSSVCFAFCCCRFLMLYEDKIRTHSKKRIFKAVDIISDASLEIYLIQQPIIDSLKQIVFPGNIILIGFSIVCAGYCIHLASNSVVCLLGKVIK